MDSIIELMNECIAEDIEAICELMDEDITPMIKYRQKLEKEAFEKAYSELKKLEEEL